MGNHKGWRFLIYIGNGGGHIPKFILFAAAGHDIVSKKVHHGHVITMMVSIFKVVNAIHR